MAMLVVAGLRISLLYSAKVTGCDSVHRGRAVGRAGVNDQLAARGATAERRSSFRPSRRLPGRSRRMMASVERRSASPSRTEGPGARTKGDSAGSRHCHAGHDPPLVIDGSSRKTAARRSDAPIDLGPSRRSPNWSSAWPTTTRPGLHKNTRRPPAPRSRDRQEHRQSDPARPQARACAGEKESDELEDVYRRSSR